MLETKEKTRPVFEIPDLDTTPREVIPVHEEPPARRDLSPVYETRYIPYRPRPGLPAPDAEQVWETVSAIVDNGGKVIHWTVFGLVRLAGVAVLILAHVVRLAGLLILALFTALSRGLTGGHDPEDVDWEPERPRGRGTQNVNINITQNNY